MAQSIFLVFCGFVLRVASVAVATIPVESPHVFSWQKQEADEPRITMVTIEGVKTPREERAREENLSFCV